MTYLDRIAIAVNQGIHALFNGSPDETISAASFRWHLQDKRHWPRVFINLLFFWQKDHCYSAWHNEIERRHLPDFYRI